MDASSPKIEATTSQTAALTNSTNSGTRQEASISLEEIEAPPAAGEDVQQTLIFNAERRPPARRNSN